MNKFVIGTVLGLSVISAGFGFVYFQSDSGQESAVEQIPGAKNVDMEEEAMKSSKTYTQPPEMNIDKTKKYTAVVETSKGTITLELFADKTPVTVNNFVFLAREGFYDGTIFHRVIEGFMAQGGDPEGTGRGGPGYRFEDEFVDTLEFDARGLLAMANAGPGTNGSQFFITFGPAEHLTGAHTIFGWILPEDQASFDTLDAIEAAQTTQDRPVDPITITSIKINEQ